MSKYFFEVLIKKWFKPFLYYLLPDEPELERELELELELVPELELDELLLEELELDGEYDGLLLDEERLGVELEELLDLLVSPDEVLLLLDEDGLEYVGCELERGVL